MCLDAVYFPPPSIDSPRYRCDSNASTFLYNPHTRRVHLVGNDRCLVVNEKSYHYLASEDFPTVNALRSMACADTETEGPMGYLIWGSEFRLIRDKNNQSKAHLQFISPIFADPYAIYVRGNILVVVDEDDEARRVLDQLRQPSLHIIGNVPRA